MCRFDIFFEKSAELLTFASDWLQYIYYLDESTEDGLIKTELMVIYTETNISMILPN